MKEVTQYLDSKILESISPILSNISLLLKKSRNQFLLVSMDEYILDIALKQVIQKTEYEPVYVNDKDLDPDGKLFIIKLHNSNSLSYQSLLYYYLELSIKKNCHVCFYSSNSLCLNYFEKRVKSRFDNKIFFLPFFDLKNLDLKDFPYKNQLEAFSEKKSSVNDLINFLYQIKYNIKDYSFIDIFNLLEPLHFILIFISFNNKLDYNNVVTLFKSFSYNLDEIKKSTNSSILYAYYDILDFKLINTKGYLLFDKNEFIEYVNKNCPLYIKKVLNKLI